MHVDDDGRFRLRGDLDADHGRLVDAALHEARDRLFHAGQIDVTSVDALIDVINRSLDTAPPGRRQRFRVNLFLDPATPLGARWADGTAVPDAITRHLTCDATLTPTFTAHRRPVDVGAANASSPTAPAASSTTATGPAASRGAPTPTPSKCTTSSTGATAAAPTWPT